MRTIRQQLLIWLLGGMVVSILASGSAFYVKVREEANELFDAQLRQVAASLPVGALPQSQYPREENLEDDIVVQVWDRTGTLIYVSRPGLALQRYPHTGLRTVSIHDERWRVYGEPRRDRFIQVAQPIAVRQELAAGLALRSLLPLFVLIPMLALLIWLVVGRSLRPLQRVTLAVGTRSPDDLEPLATEGLSPELRPMLDALNDLLGRLGHALSAQRAFVADAAHELRSPLTALKLQLQLAERAPTDAQRAAEIAKLHVRLNRAIHLVQQLLTLARYEPHVEESIAERVDLQRLAQEVVADLVPLADAKAIDLGVEADTGAVFVQGQKEALRVMLGNLVNNAITYTPSHGRIDVIIFHSGEHPALRVVDTGAGILSEERARVFDRFYRKEGSGVPGSGLGLAIVKNIIERHGANIRLEDSPSGRGLAVTVVFPP